MPRSLGKAPVVHDPRVPTLRALLRTAVNPPSDCNWYAPVGEWPMLANDTVGDCVEACALHAIQQRIAYVGDTTQPTADDAIQLYGAWAGYDADDLATDRGTVMTTALAAWAKSGISYAGGARHDLLAGYAQVDHVNTGWLQRAIWHCGSVAVGLNCPLRWLTATYLLDLQPGDASNIAGGHCVLLVGYETTALGIEFDTITWGGRFRVTQGALEALADEAYGLLDADFNDARGVGPDSIAWADRNAAMRALRA